MKKIYLGAISALLLASCTTIQKVSKYSENLKETTTSFSSINKKHKIIPAQTYHMKIEKQFLYDNDKFHEIRTFYFYPAMIEDKEENTISSTDSLFVSEGNNPKRKFLGDTNSQKFASFLEKINRPKKRGSVTIRSKFYYHDSLLNTEEYYIENNS